MCGRYTITLLPDRLAERFDAPTPDPESWLSLPEPYPAEQMALYPVSTSINSPRNDDPTLIEPV